MTHKYTLRTPNFKEYFEKKEEALPVPVPAARWLLVSLSGLWTN